MHTTSEKQQWQKTLQNKDPSNTFTTLPTHLQLPRGLFVLVTPSKVQVDPALLYTVYNSHAEKSVPATLNGRSLFFHYFLN